MTDASPTPAAPVVAPRGWYPDPQLPGRERWWTGAEWSDYTHRGPGSTSLGPRYTRSYWIGPNVEAGKAQVFTRVASILLLAAVVFACIVGALLLTGAVWQFALIGSFAVSGLLHIGGIVFGRRGLAQGDMLGAKGASISSVVVSSIELLLCACAVLVLSVLLALGVT